MPDNKCESLDPMRGRSKAEDGGAGNAGYAKTPTKNWDENADYTRPKSRPDPYNSPNDRGRD